MPRRKGWSQLDTNEKLEALRADLNVALDGVEELQKWKKQIEVTLKRIAVDIFELKERR